MATNLLSECILDEQDEGVGRDGKWVLHKSNFMITNILSMNINEKQQMKEKAENLKWEIFRATL